MLADQCMRHRQAAKLHGLKMREWIVAPFFDMLPEEEKWLADAMAREGERPPTVLRVCRLAPKLGLAAPASYRLGRGDLPPATWVVESFKHRLVLARPDAACCLDREASKVLRGLVRPGDPILLEGRFAGRVSGGRQICTPYAPDIGHDLCNWDTRVEPLSMPRPVFYVDRASRLEPARCIVDPDPVEVEFCPSEFGDVPSSGRIWAPLGMPPEAPPEDSDWKSLIAMQGYGGR